MELKRYKAVLAGMLSVALGFGIALPLGFWLRPKYPAMSDNTFAVLIVVVLIAVSLGVMRIVNGPIWPARASRTVLTAHHGFATGYAITLRDFYSLVSDPPSQTAVAPLLREWFALEIHGKGEEARVCTAAGQAVPLEELHILIQRDPPKQYTIYQTAMTLWR